jgi:hypothetical protein
MVASAAGGLARSPSGASAPLSGGGGPSSSAAATPRAGPPSALPPWMDAEKGQGGGFDGARGRR